LSLHLTLAFSGVHVLPGVFPHFPLSEYPNNVHQQSDQKVHTTEGK